MVSRDLTSLTCAQASNAIHDRTVTASELTQAVLEVVFTSNDDLRCYGLVVGDRALAQARALDGLLDAGVDLGPMHGIPIAIKDCIDTAGVATTMGSQLESDRVPVEDASLVRSLYRSGAVLIGKANLYEWAYGGPSTLWGEAFNPWRLDATAGASSNGSAVAVASGLAIGAVGSDTGGSIRLPAAFCGVFGLKPTFGRISHTGTFPPASSLDHVGPLTRDVEGGAIMLGAMAGYDRRDQATWGAPLAADYRLEIGRSVDGLRVGVPVRQTGEVLADDIAAAIQHVIAVLRDAGCRIVDVEIPSLIDARTLLWAISGPEIAEAQKSVLRNKSEFLHPNARKLMRLGEFVPATEYVHSFRIRQQMMDQMSQVFDRVEAVVMPVVPLPAWRSGQDRFEIEGVIEDDMNLLTRYCPLFNLTGHPAASVLAGFNHDGLPLAVQMVAPLFDEAAIFRLASVFEKATAYVDRRPMMPGQESVS
jgi:aspartyl-tRNA(Asn)/glutamyl-tRNA(Gln) amidotransferase subunit A